MCGFYLSIAKCGEDGKGSEETSMYCFQIKSIHQQCVIDYESERDVARSVNWVGRDEQSMNEDKTKGMSKEVPSSCNCQLFSRLDQRGQELVEEIGEMWGNRHIYMSDYCWRLAHDQRYCRRPLSLPPPPCQDHKSIEEKLVLTAHL